MLFFFSRHLRFAWQTVTLFYHFVLVLPTFSGPARLGTTLSRGKTVEESAALSGPK